MLNRRKTKLLCIDGWLRRSRFDVVVQVACSCHSVCALCGYPLDRRVFQDSACHNLAKRSTTSSCNMSKTTSSPLQVKSRCWYTGVRDEVLLQRGVRVPAPAAASRSYMVQVSRESILSHFHVLETLLRDEAYIRILAEYETDSNSAPLRKSCVSCHNSGENAAYQKDCMAHVMQ